MKVYFSIFLVTFILGSCCQSKPHNLQRQTVSTKKTVKNIEPENDESKTQVFPFAKDFPIINDTAKFITSLRYTFNLEIGKFEEQKDNERINCLKKISLNGSDKDLLLIEYDYRGGAGATFPWKYQIVMTLEGKIVEVLSGLRYELLSVNKNENPYLLVLTSTSKGNGTHQLYKFSNDSLENVLEKTTYFPRTYDDHSDQHINVPRELTLKVKDENGDGFKDLSFNGKMIKNRIGNSVDDDPSSNEEIPLKLIFIFDKKTGHFKELEDYSLKYPDN